MKTMKKKNIIVAALTVAGLFVGCSDEFLNRPPEDTLLDLNFYKTDQQLLSATAPLYSAAWKTYIDQANFKLGDIRGGTVYRAWGDRDAVEFNITGVSPANEQAYKAFYVVVGNANAVINNIKKFGGPALTERGKNEAIAEARFMRAAAYTHLVMNYDAVPIIEDNEKYIFNPSVRRNNRESVWEFIRRDFHFAAEHLPEEATQPGRVTKWSAEGMLARTYLTLAGLNASPGARNQEYLDKAKEYAERVITMSGKSLMPFYEQLFLYPYDNNQESLFELQWVFSIDPQVGYDAANTMVSQITYSNDIAANGDGWGGDLSASWWMLSLYDGLITKGDLNNPDDDGQTAGFTTDQRLKATFMLPGFTYPELKKKTVNDDGKDVEIPLVFANPGSSEQFSYASIKKYVVGKANGQADRQRYPNNTYMLRLAEMYLIYAEAALGNNSETTDAKALEYFNMVYGRAHKDPANPDTQPPVWTDPLTWEDIFEERAKEFAMESMIWYDIVRLHYYDSELAYTLLNSQERGLFVVRANQWPNPTAWSFEKTSWSAFRNVSAGPSNFRIPIPSSEMAQAPTLNLEPVDYEFSE